MLRVSMRPALRDRHWVLLLAIVLIAIPTALASYFSMESHSRERFSQTTNRENVLVYQGGTCTQGITGWSNHCTGVEDNPALPEPMLTAPEELTTGLHAISQGTVLLSNNGTAVEGWVTAIDPAISLFGENTPEVGEVVLSQRDAQRLGVSVGSQVEATLATEDGEQSTTLTVSNVGPGWDTTVVSPTLPIGQATNAVTEYILVQDTPMTWQQVLDYNAQGFVVRSQSVMQNPPPIEEVPAEFQDEYRFYVLDNPRLEGWLFTFLGLSAYTAIGTILLLLIAPVFAVISTRKTREYALMRSQGATTGAVKVAVTTYGLIAGVLGAALGTLAGIGFFVVSWKQQFPTWPITFPIGWLLAFFGIAVLGSVVSAFLPAIFASRANIVGSMEGAQADRLLRWRPWMLIGPVALAILAIICAVYTRFTSNYDNLLFTEEGPESTWKILIVGVLYFTVVGAIIPAVALSIPAAVYGLGLISRPLGARIGARLLRRQWLKSVPVAAGIAALTFAGLWMSSTGSYTTQAEQQTFEGSFSVELQDSALRQFATSTDTAGTSLPALSQSLQFTLANPGDYYEARDFSAQATLGVQAIEGNSESLALFKLDDARRAEALKALGEGKILVSSAADVGDTAVFRLDDFSSEEGARAFEAPVAAVLPPYFTGMLVPMQAAQEYNIPMDAQAIVTTSPSESGLVVAHIEEQPDRTPQMRVALMVSALCLVILAGLSVLDSRAAKRQQAQLAAIGAYPSTLASIGAWQLGLLAWVGSWIGLGSGVLMKLATSTPTTYDDLGRVLAFSTHGLDANVFLGMLVVGVLMPLLAAGVGYLLTAFPKADLQSA
ncbi:ABC transporter permease [Corynebacterium kozikiae]|uniref:ABC transporter permease n=1 Tax=Corynebacterium kozikiae TaxID=2968469 RepID=UPI00211CDB7A|nr:FtsX-like permease family protein [Corynebacterium sp. 76QC2CO]MCQ9344189.1 hypothetical protein [Corynebacterium sp. 76QC2CO]